MLFAETGAVDQLLDRMAPAIGKKGGKLSRLDIAGRSALVAECSGTAGVGMIDKGPGGPANFAASSPRTSPVAAASSPVISSNAAAIFLAREAPTTLTSAGTSAADAGAHHRFSATTSSGSSLASVVSAAESGSLCPYEANRPDPSAPRPSDSDGRPWGAAVDRSGKSVVREEALMANLAAGQKTVVVVASAGGEYEAFARAACEGREPPASLEIVDIDGAEASGDVGPISALVWGRRRMEKRNLGLAMAAADRSGADVLVLRVPPKPGMAGR